MPPISDGRFGAELRRHRMSAGLSLRQLAPLVLSSRGHLHDLESGRRHPTVDLAGRLDDALHTSGLLSGMLHPAPTSDDPNRLAYVTQHPRRLDPETLHILGEMLAAHRRLEDTLGSTPLIPTIRTQLDLVTTLVAESAGGLRQQVVDLAAQWAQFGGWLYAASDRRRLASRWYGTALEWGTEAGNADMVATVLSMRGHLAWSERRPGPLIGLSAAAVRQPASSGVRAIATQQQARGHALTGEANVAIDLLDRATELNEAAMQAPDREPPWIYFHSAAYLTMQRGLAYRLLGWNAQAIEYLRLGLTGLPAGSSAAAWTGPYLLHLAAALVDNGNVGEALDVYERVLALGHATHTVSLVDQVEAAVRALSARR
ncbi:helix-turn-helix domain-containing protein [Micromonospora craniellae]|uniref:XRE family transcriptional regulator n=1 Tax=Micromonospora craniellae TaxID=2294034 RepID=A0A372G2R6_9ACTN|nr:helix-turn-helix transcriptional regulator [Micromonospora craniellae]QOC89912.1 helix-turn-helix transcriptional regulator [Micromonospora craniellae]RFS47059.1 XRE family transcriptional regulator [Micromonospora craniellae]